MCALNDDMISYICGFLPATLNVCLVNKMFYKTTTKKAPMTTLINTTEIDNKWLWEEAKINWSYLSKSDCDYDYEFDDGEPVYDDDEYFICDGSDSYVKGPSRKSFRQMEFEFNLRMKMIRMAILMKDIEYIVMIKAFHYFKYELANHAVETNCELIVDYMFSVDRCEASLLLFQCASSEENTVVMDMVLARNPDPLLYNKYFIKSMVEMNHVNSLRHLRNKGLQFDWHINTLNKEVIENTSVSAHDVEWLVDNGCPCIHNLMGLAAECGRYDILALTKRKNKETQNTMWQCDDILAHLLYGFAWSQWYDIYHQPMLSTPEKMTWVTYFLIQGNTWTKPAHCVDYLRILNDKMLRNHALESGLAECLLYDDDM